MFGDDRKTIGLFVNRPELDFPRVICSTIAKYAKQNNYNVVVFSSFCIREANNDYEKLESDIILFAPLEKLDAIVVALDTYDTNDLRECLLKTIKKRFNGPVVSYRELYDGFYSVISDANNAIADVIEHLVSVHNVSKIAFMSGYKGHYDAEQRCKVYLEQCKKLNLNIYDNFVFHGDMWKGKAKEAFEFFFVNSDVKPEAVVCANDYMARSLGDEVLSRGMSVPEDVIITGVDNLAEAYDCEPNLTTIAFDADELSKNVIMLLNDYFEGKECKKVVKSKTRIIYRESCGCKKCRETEEKKHTYEETDFTLSSNRQTFFAFDMSECDDLFQIKNTIKDNLSALKIYKEFYYFSMIDSIDEIVDLSKKNIKADLKIGIVDNEIINKKNKFDKNELVPNELIVDDDFKMYYIRILHNRDKTFGYVVLRVTEEPYVLDYLYHYWCLTLSITMNTMFIREKLQQLITQNYEFAIKDYMTGLYNRRGFERFIHSNWENWIAQNKEMYFVSVDLDGLKNINDKYGHQEGDFAIISVAKALKSSIGEIGIAARVGGDEFCAVVDKCDADVKTRITKSISRRLKTLNKKSNKPYLVDCSIGFYRKIIDENTKFDECMTYSDLEMYKMKYEKKKMR